VEGSVFAQGAKLETVAEKGGGHAGADRLRQGGDDGRDSGVVLEPDARRREMAMRFGAIAALDGTQPPAEILAKVKELSGARGANAGLDCAGYPESIEPGLTLLRMSGRIVIAGATFPTRPAQIAAVAGRYPFAELVEKISASGSQRRHRFCREGTPLRVASIP
jgi:threonine dehydrogenase-like Zn-dependent dehydrogenase